ncbi:MAG: LD-carboxypeptidase [Schleiferiaceae bacterium]|nr:LD-carboxypeptidase [Schleiferiaceae bacterium]
MKAPKALQKGDQVALISTARAVSPADMAPAQALLKDWGLQPREGPHLYQVHHQMAGTAQQRAADLTWALKTPAIKAIFCARGGYGSIQLLDHFDPDLITRHPKWMVGFSDVTVLHNLYARHGLMSIHASMPSLFGQNTPEALTSLRQALFGEAYQISAPAHPFNQSGKAQGPLTGGNLSMLYSQCGSPTRLHTRGQLLFLEDIDEYLYHLDRMLYNLRYNGYLEAPAGILLGGFTDMNDHEIPFGETAHEILHRHLGHLGIPVAYDLPAGHVRDHRALVFGQVGQMWVGPKGTLLTFDQDGRA